MLVPLHGLHRRATCKRALVCGAWGHARFLCAPPCNHAPCTRTMHGTQHQTLSKQRLPPHAEARAHGVGRELDDARDAAHSAAERHWRWSLGTDTQPQIRLRCNVAGPCSSASGPAAARPMLVCDARGAKRCKRCRWEVKGLWQRGLLGKPRCCNRCIVCQVIGQFSRWWSS